jgi:hypothetical protein
MAHYLEHLENVDAVVPYEVLMVENLPTVTGVLHTCPGFVGVRLMTCFHLLTYAPCTSILISAFRNSKICLAALGGMDERLFGYGPQFPEFFPI